MTGCGPGDKLDIVYFLRFYDWETNFRKPYHLELAKHCKLLCVEPPISLVEPLRMPALFFKWVRGARGLRQISNNLYLYRPIALVPYFGSVLFPTFSGPNKFLMQTGLKRAVNELGMKNIVSIISHPAMHCVIGMLSERVLCYEVFDEYTKYPQISTQGSRKLRTVEEDLVRKANIVFASSRNLAEGRKRLNPNTYFIPHAVDVEHFEKSRLPETPIPLDLLQIKPPRLGFIGNVNERTDMELLNCLAQESPDLSIVIIGRIDGSPTFIRSSVLSKSRGLPNVHYLGFKDYEVLPNYLKGLDVCLMPYKITDYMVNVYPNKLHQYLAGGKPVVSTNLPSMEPFKDVVYIARSRQDFIRLVQRTLEETNETLIARRIGVARENTIEKQIARKVEMLCSLWRTRMTEESNL